MNFCGDCGNKLVGGACGTCTAKSTSGLNVESLEKSLATLEKLSKGVRPAEAPDKQEDNRTAKKVVEDAKAQSKKYGDKGEGESEEEPKTKRGIESAIKGFVPDQEDEEEEEDADPRKKAEEEAEMEAEMGRGGGEPQFKSAKSKKAKKSFSDDLLEQEPVRKAVDVSDFLESVVYQLGDYTEGLRDDVSKSLAFHGYQQKYNIGLAKALGELATLVKSLGEKVETIGKLPANVRKSVLSEAAIEKSFAGNNPNPSSNLSKSEIAEKLTSLMASGDKSVTEMDVLRADSTGLVRPELRAKIGMETA